MKLKDIAGDHVLSIPIAAQSTAGTPDSFGGVRVPFACTVQSVGWTPQAAVTANGTNYVVLSLLNGGQTGASTTSVATRSYAATNSVALTAEAMTLSGTAANLNLAEGDILYVDRAVTASGVATPKGTVNVVVRAR